MTQKKIAVIGECMIEVSEKGESIKRGFGGDTLNTTVYLARLVDSAQLSVDYVTAPGTLIQRRLSGAAPEQRLARECGTMWSSYRQPRYSTSWRHYPMQRYAQLIALSSAGLFIHNVS